MRLLSCGHEIAAMVPHRLVVQVGPTRLVEMRPGAEVLDRHVLVIVAVGDEVVARGPYGWPELPRVAA